MPTGIKTDDVIQAWEKCGRVNTETAKVLGVSEATVRRHVSKRFSAAPSAESRLSAAYQQIRKLEHELGEEARLRDELISLSNSTLKVPEWILKVPAKSSHLTGVPTLFCSDWHYGEVVNATEIGKVNSYNTTIARQRVRNLVAVATELLTQHIAKPSYPGIIMALGGDMISGETNEIESMPVLLELLGVLIWVVNHLRSHFNNVFIPCVTGNHGRLSYKPRAKRRNHTNFDWLLYKLLERHFEHDKKVTFMIPDGPDASYMVYGHRYLLTHGDQFRGGDGMIGPIGPITRGDHKKRTRQMQVGQAYDTMLMGHWHQWMPLPSTIVNGSLKGYDEWANSCNLRFEPPKQGLWLTHPHHGITFTMPVYADRPMAKPDKKTSWVSIPG